MALMADISTSLTDPRVLISLGSFIVSLTAVVIAWYSFRNSNRAIAIAEEQEKRRQPSTEVFCAQSIRLRLHSRQVFAFQVSIKNPSDINNSIARAELRIEIAHADEQTPTRFLLAHVPDASRYVSNIPDKKQVIALPQRIDAHQSILGWLIFVLPNDVVNNGTVIYHSIVLEDTHKVKTKGASIAVIPWIDETAAI